MRVLGLFAKHPTPGAVKTRLAHEIGELAAAEFAEACLRDVVDRFADAADARWLGYAPQTPAARQWFGELAGERYHLWPQPSGDLGQRIESFFAAVNDAYGAVSPNIVLIGSDSPTLPRDYVEAAWTALDAADVVLGPAADGGYYLIGGRRFPAGWLDGVRWSTPWTLADTVAGAERQRLTLAVLPLWTDIDTPDDLPAAWGHVRALRIAGRLAAESHCEAWLSGWAARQTS